MEVASLCAETMPAWVNWLSPAKEFLVAVAAVATIIIALVGLRTWKRELRGKANFDLAVTVKGAAKELERQIKYFRNPWQWPSEFPPDYDFLGQNDDREEARAQSYVYGNRWEKMAPAIRNFEGALVSAEVLWDDKLSGEAGEIKTHLASLKIAVEQHISVIDNRGRHPAEAETEESIQDKLEDTGAENSSFTSKLDASFKRFYDLLDKELRKHA